MTDSNEKKLIDIIIALDVPKDRWNEFGQFNYRSAEDIITALKPELHKVGLIPFCTFRVEERAGHMYQVARVFVLDGQMNLVGDKTVEGWAREDEKRTKMDAPQLSGSAASYAEKRAWGGYLGLNDEVDPDAHNDGNSKKATRTTKEVPTVDTITDPQVKSIKTMLSTSGLIAIEHVFKGWLSTNKLIDGESTKDLTKAQAAHIIGNFNALITMMFADKTTQPIILEAFKVIEKDQKIKIIQFMLQQIEEEIPLPDYVDANTKALDSYCHLFLTTIHNQEANKLMEFAKEKGVTVEEALKVFTSKGMKPQIVNHIDLDQEGPGKEDQQTKTVTEEDNIL